MDQLEYLAQTYFHPDWDLEATTAVGVLVNFLRDEPTEDVAALVRELTRILSTSPSEEELHDIWLRRSGALWDPTSGGWQTYREWFDTMLKVVS